MYEKKYEKNGYEKRPYSKKRTYVKNTAKVFDVYTDGTRFQVCSCDIKNLLDSLKRNGCTNIDVQSFEVAI